MRPATTLEETTASQELFEGFTEDLLKINEEQSENRTRSEKKEEKGVMKVLKKHKDRIQSVLQQSSNFIDSAESLNNILKTLEINELDEIIDTAGDLKPLLMIVEESLNYKNNKTKQNTEENKKVTKKIFKIIFKEYILENIKEKGINNTLKFLLENFKHLPKMNELIAELIQSALGEALEELLSDSLLPEIRNIQTLTAILQGKWSEISTVRKLGLAAPIAKILSFIKSLTIATTITAAPVVIAPHSQIAQDLTEIGGFVKEKAQDLLKDPAPQTAEKKVTIKMQLTVLEAAHDKASIEIANMKNLEKQAEIARKLDEAYTSAIKAIKNGDTDISPFKKGTTTFKPDSNEFNFKN